MEKKIKKYLNKAAKLRPADIELSPNIEAKLDEIINELRSGELTNMAKAYIDSHELVDGKIRFVER